MEARMVKATSEDVPDKAFGNSFLPERDVRKANDTESTTQAYQGLPADIKRTQGVKVVENPKRDTTYSKTVDDNSGAVRAWKPKGRRD